MPLGLVLLAMLVSDLELINEAYSNIIVAKDAKKTIAIFLG